MNANRPLEDLIRDDHNEVRALLNRYKSSQNRDEALKWYHQFVWELTRHVIAEELIFYPLLRDRVTNGQVLADIDIDQHRKVKEDLVKIQSLDVNSPEFDQNVQIMWNDLISHMDKEESTDLKIFAQDVPLEERINAAKKFENRKLIAPTRPHTMIPDTSPTLEAILGMLIAPYDKFRDLFTSFPDKKEVEQIVHQKVDRDRLGGEVQNEVNRP